MMTGPDGALRPPKVRRPAAAPRVPSPLISRFAATLALAPANRKTAKIQAFWAHAAAHGTPLIEPAQDDGQQIVTFVWRAPADQFPVAVHLSVVQLTDERDLQHSLMSQVPGTDIWHLSFQLDADWSARYCFSALSADGVPPISADADQVDIRRLLDAGVPDPLNPARVRGDDGRELSMVSITAVPPQFGDAAQNIV
jgi:enterochelin esterase family protein